MKKIILFILFVAILFLASCATQVDKIAEEKIVPKINETWNEIYENMEQNIKDDYTNSFRP